MGARPVSGRPRRRLDRRAEAGRCAPLEAEGLHGLQGGEALAGEADRLGGEVLDRCGGAAQPPAEDQERRQEQGNEQEQGRRGRVEDGQQAQRAHQAEEVSKAHRGQVARQVLHRGHVAGQARQHLSRITPGQGCGVQPHHVVVQAPPQVRPHPLAEHGDEVDAQPRGDGETEGDPAQRQQRREQVPSVVRPPGPVDGEAAGDGQRQDRSGRQQHRQGRRRSQPGMGRGGGEQPADHPRAAPGAIRPGEGLG